MHCCCLYLLAYEEVVMGYRAIIEWENALGMLRHETFIGSSFLAVKREAEGWIERHKASGLGTIKETLIYQDPNPVIAYSKPSKTKVCAPYKYEGSTDAEILRKRY